jgi:hypothetical protein
MWARFGRRGERVRAGLDKWWLLPFGILAASVLVALSIVVFRPAFVERSFAGVGLRAPSEPLVDCSGALASDYACYQQRYQALARNSDVEAAFDELKGEYAKNDIVRLYCHQLTHVIGRTAAERYGDITGAYGRGDEFCGAGYYHGAMEAIAAEIGADKIVEEASTLCADLSEGQERSYQHRNCVHGLGHGFMAAQENELFESLRACDALADEWESEHCYNGVFMQNVMAKEDPSHPTKYLKADQPLYPCTDVEARYKNQCYKKQTTHALETRGNDFAKVFDLCTTVEDDFRPACYHGIGWDSSMLGINGESITRVAKTELPGVVCTLSDDYEAQSNCIVGAVKAFIQFYDSDAEAKALCESLKAEGLRAACLQAGEEYHESLEA